MAEETQVEPGEPPELKYMDLDEFVSGGYLLEVNRQFFHPLGLGLEVRTAPDGKVVLISGIWDCRDDPEGIIFGDDVLDSDTVKTKHNALLAEQERWAARRFKALGYVIQPMPGETSE